MPARDWEHRGDACHFLIPTIHEERRTASGPASWATGQEGEGLDGGEVSACGPDSWVLIFLTMSMNTRNFS
jgi:hypothetical protein